MDTHEIPIPVERVEEALRQAAVAGWWGSLSIVFQLFPLQPGLFELQYHVTRNTTTQSDLVREGGPLFESPRITEVTQRLAEVKHKLKIVIPVIEIKASFKDGQMTGPIQTVERFWLPVKI